jgi:LysR family transcriptional regulator, transcriptional activator of the cysJI operon
MEIRHLQTFVAVAELRHFARAADRCSLSQPAVSHQIRLLEEELGTRLLNRDGRRVSLTVAGELFLDDARGILAAVDRARGHVQGISSGVAGRVRIGATGTPGLYVLPPVLARFRREHPRFALQFTIAPELDLLDQVAANDLDLAVLAGRPVLGELRARAIGQDDLVLVVAAGSSLATRTRIKASDLLDEPWVVREPGSDMHRQLDAWRRRHRVSPLRTLVLQGADAVKRAVVAGLGVALLSRAVVAEELATRRVVTLPLTQPPPPRPVLVVDHPQKHHGAACRAMLAMLPPR